MWGILITKRSRLSFGGGEGRGKGLLKGVGQKTLHRQQRLVLLTSLNQMERSRCRALQTFNSKKQTNKQTNLMTMIAQQQQCVTMATSWLCVGGSLRARGGSPTHRRQPGPHTNHEDSRGERR